MIAIIDYDAGNIKSVEKALISLGEKAVITRDREEILTASFDLDEIEKNRMSWGIFRDRRPECYERIFT